MKFGEVYDLILLKLREDYDNPSFWEEFEIVTYMKIAINKIIRKSNIILNDKSLPLVPKYDGGYVEGVYSISELLAPSRLKIQQIKQIYWQYEYEGDLYSTPLKILRPFEMDKLDHAWRSRKCANNEYPTHAIVYGGSAEMINQSTSSLIENNELMQFANPKVHLYPKPPLPENYEEGIQEILDIIDEFNNSGDGLAVAVTDDDPVGYIPENVLNIDFENITETLSPPDAFALIERIESYIERNMIGYLPIVLYKPIFDFDYDHNNGSWKRIDLDFLTDELQLSIVNFVRSEAYNKEGQTENMEKANIYENKFKQTIVDDKAENVAFQPLNKRRDGMYP